jgi:type IV pilus assembly protein PilM
MDVTSIGLDIGSAAVRAAEVGAGGGRPVLRRYGQVGLPPGAVVDGEIADPTAVTQALRRLWAEGGFSSSKVVLGVSGHRVIVRQADVPALDEEDLRSALRFSAQEIIPIPMDNASFDFRVLDRTPEPGEDGKASVRILLVAGHRDVLLSHIAVLKSAGLEATAIEAAPLALLRLAPLPEPGPDGSPPLEALVAMGAEITTVAVRQGVSPRFIRSLAIGGDKLTAGIANSLQVDRAVAERIKRSAFIDAPTQVAEVQRAASQELHELAEEVRATVDFFASQSDGAVVDRILVTGGASQTHGLIESLGDTSGTQVLRMNPFALVDAEHAGLDQDQLALVAASGTTAIGLALWAVESDGPTRLSILPEDVAQARRNRRLAAVAAGGVAVLAGLLALGTGSEYLAVHHTRTEVRTALRHAASLQETVNLLQAKAVVHREAVSRQALVVSALGGDINWVGLINQLDALLPPGTTITSFSGQRTVTTSSTAAPASSSATPSDSVGAVSLSLTGPGGLPTAAAWLKGLEADKSVQGSWLSDLSVSPQGDQVTFNADTDLTPKIDSNRAEEVTK